MSMDETQVVAFVIGAVKKGDIELRYRLDCGHWVPEIVVNHRTKEVSSPPECFQPMEEDLDGLDEAVRAMIREEGIVA